MSKTRTGRFDIGFRQTGKWCDDLKCLMVWMQQNDFVGFDIRDATVDQIKMLIDAGVKVGSVDLPQPWSDLTSADTAKRNDAAQRAAEYIKPIAALGPKNFFLVGLADNPAQPRKEVFTQAIDGYGQLCAAIGSSGARLVFEGWPRDAATLACTPADCRSLFNELPEGRAGINFDPSHLIRMGIDPVPFLEEFAPKVYHVHGKDAKIICEQLQEHGHQLPPTFVERRPYSGFYWRYTIPGHGSAHWSRLLAILQEVGYQGMISIELEDANFHGDEAIEKQGLMAARDFLVNC